MKKPIFTKISKNDKCKWQNFYHSYLFAAEVLSHHIANSANKNKLKQTTNESWKNEIMIIPLLFLLRHVLELSLKSVLIVYTGEFENTHNLIKLLKKVKECFNFKYDSNLKKVNEIEFIVKEFAKTKYGSKERIFTNDDIGINLRYFQTSKHTKYSYLKTINHVQILRSVKRAVLLCEAYLCFM
jgi:hypothetical protein